MTISAPPSILDKGPPAPCPEPFNMAAYVLAAAERTPDKTALEVIEAPGLVAERWSYDALARAIRGTMAGLAAAGLERGDTLLLRIGHSVDFPILFFAAVGLGAIAVPSSAQLTGREVTAILTRLSPKLIVGDPALVPEGTPILPTETYRPWRDLPPADFARTAADDPAYLVFTSGTGSEPKAVMHAQRAAWARRMMWEDWYGLTPDDRLLHAGAFNWTYTLGTGLTDPWAAGATALIFTGTPDRNVWAALVAEHRPTLFAAAPGIYRQLLSSETATRDAFAGLRHGLTAGDTLPAAQRQRWEAVTGTAVYEALGMSEISTYASEPPGGQGLQAQRGRRLAVLAEDGTPAPRGEEGEIAVSSRDPGLMLGYWEAGRTTLPLTGEWFRTGDRGAISESGILTHLGRSSDLMNAQGYRVSAKEVEQVLLAHADVAEAAVLSVRVREDVEVIGAFIVPTAPGKVTEEALAAHCAAGLARYKCPRLYHLLAALPRTATGKVQKHALAALISAETAS